MSKNINEQMAYSESVNKQQRSRVWFCVLHNVALNNIGLSLPCDNPSELLDNLSCLWSNSGSGRIFSGCYAVSADNLHHIHAVLSTSSACTLSAVQRVFPGIHAENMRGTKEQASAYLRKEGNFAEKGEKVLAELNIDCIQSNQGKRNDITFYGELLNQGYTPDRIFYECGIVSERYKREILDHFYLLRSKSVHCERNVGIYWHTGESGSGKSYTYVKLCEKYGEDDVYFLTDYEHPWDGYYAQRFVVMDEFKANVRLDNLLTWLQGYKSQLTARYSNRLALFSELHITSVYTPESAFNIYLQRGAGREEACEQLLRRITLVNYHIKIAPNVYRVYDFPNKDDWHADFMKKKSIELYHKECEDFASSREKMIEVSSNEELPL